jgi:transcriptional regulator with XRE-family HTH domain
MNNNSSLDSKEERGKRLKRLRQFLRLSRPALAKKCDNVFSFTSVEGWEEGRFGGLTIKSAQQLVQGFNKEGIPVSLEWLMFGTGEDPLIPRKKSEDYKTKKELTEYEIIAKELALFHQLNKNSIDAVITDDGMSPWLLPGDFVAGERYLGENVEKAIGSVCIVQPQSGNVLVRKVNSGNDLQYYNLVCINSNTKLPHPIIEDVKLISAAPILWIRKLRRQD